MQICEIVMFGAAPRLQVESVYFTSRPNRPPTQDIFTKPEQPTLRGVHTVAIPPPREGHLSTDPRRALAVGRIMGHGSTCRGGAGA